jgi:transcriptional regulator with XRE-family HTH domain
MPKKKKKAISNDSSASSDKGSAKQPSKNRIRELRNERKWTQWQLAKISRLSQRTIQRIERGGHFGVTAEMALANAFEVGIAELYESEYSDLAVDFIFLC